MSRAESVMMGSIFMTWHVRIVSTASSTRGGSTLLRTCSRWRCLSRRRPVCWLLVSGCRCVRHTGMWSRPWCKGESPSQRGACCSPSSCQDRWPSRSGRMPAPVRPPSPRRWPHWVIDLNIRAFFDGVPWDLVLKAIAAHTDPSPSWVLLYVRRWPAAPLQLPDGARRERTGGRLRALRFRRSSPTFSSTTPSMPGWRGTSPPSGSSGMWTTRRRQRTPGTLRARGDREADGRGGP